MKATAKYLCNSDPVKYYLVGTLAALSLQASALDFSPDTTRIISDPAYLPTAGQVYGTTAYTFSGKYTGDVNNFAGVKKYSFDTQQRAITQSLAYGINDNLTVRLSDTYIPSSKTDFNNVAGPATETRSSGLSDPTIGFTYRIVDQKSSPVNFDVIGSYSPDIIDAKSSTTSHDGTVARGGQQGSLGVATSYETRSFTVLGSVGTNYLGSRDVRNPNTDFTTSVDSSWDYFAGVQTQTRITDQFSINAGVTYTTSNHADASNPNVAYTIKNGNVTDLNLSLNYAVIPNRLVAQLIYNRDLYDNSHNQFTVATADTTTTDHVGDVYTAKLLYVF